ncbi:hypothetical protein NPIL_483411 [Nephila pilipes]|uniref:Uncharacterized protein n=1 Tax=Nephila pilipes TaxID=299642 RepID=A0A8X6PXB5_NEPPI|nr:hypothetical protein NPIL_483411 [Nephila pilipes]
MSMHRVQQVGNFHPSFQVVLRYDNQEFVRITIRQLDRGRVPQTRWYFSTTIDLLELVSRYDKDYGKKPRTHVLQTPATAKALKTAKKSRYRGQQVGATPK